MELEQEPLKAHVVAVVQAWLNRDYISEDDDALTLSPFDTRWRKHCQAAQESVELPELTFRRVPSDTRECVAEDQFGRRVGQDSGELR